MLMDANSVGKVTAVSRDDAHRFSKQPQPSIRLLAGLGVEGDAHDAHSGTTVQHRSRVAADPTQPNLRQVHLLHAELFDELAGQGFAVSAGELGENVTTLGLGLLSLPVGTRLHLDDGAVVEITGLRNPCPQIEHSGLLSAVLSKGESGHLIRKAGIMGVVLTGGEIKAGDNIRVECPPQPWIKLERV